MEWRHGLKKWLKRTYTASRHFFCTKNLLVTFFMMLIAIALVEFMTIQGNDDDKMKMKQLQSSIDSMQRYCNPGQLVPHQAPRRFAIIRPLIEKQVDLAVWNMRRWMKSDLFPCNPSLGYGRNIDLIYYFNLDLAQHRHVAQTLYNETLKLGDVRKCFNRIKFMSRDLSPVHDGHPAGPCLMFFWVFEQPDLVKNYDYFAFFEPDVNPIKKLWMDALYEEILDRSDFWVKGSISHCGGDYSHMDYHMNGNAIYRLGSSEFNQYLREVQDYYRYPADHKWKDVGGCNGGKGGYDHALWWYMHQKDTYHIAQNWIHKFRYTDVIHNWCKHEYDPREIHKLSPNTYVVHSSWANFKDEMDSSERVQQTLGG